jgi:hypothetical protein
MSDILREVDEELRHERYKKLWDRYGLYVVGAAVLLVLAVAGWRGWEWYAARQAAESSVRFEAAMQLSRDGKPAEAEKAFDQLSKDGAAGYRTLARFRDAAETAKTDAKAGVAAFDAIAADTSLEAPMRDIARVQAAYLLVDIASVAEIKGRMDPLAVPGGAFRHSANEIIGLAHYRAGEYEQTAKIFASIVGDPETPPALRQRAQVVNALVAGAASAKSAKQ